MRPLIGPAVLCWVGATAGCWAPQPAPAHGGSATIRPVAPAVVVTLGDSVPAGAACGCTPFPALYAALLTPPGESVDLARSGYTAVDVRRQVDETATRATVRRATTVLIMAGANDISAVFDADGGDDSYARAAESVRDSVSGTVEQIRRLDGPRVPVVVLGYWNVVEDGDVARADYGPAGVAEAATATRYANDALRAAAGRSGARYVSTTTVFEGADGDTDPTALLTADGDHPNARGHELIAEAVLAARGPD